MFLFLKEYKWAKQIETLCSRQTIPCTYMWSI